MRPSTLSHLYLTSSVCLSLLPLTLATPSYNTTFTGYPPSYCKPSVQPSQNQPSYSPTPGLSTSTGTTNSSTTSPPPNKFAFLLFPSFEPLDLFGPYEALFTLARSHHLSLAWLAATLDPVSTAPKLASMNPLNSSAFLSVPPTHTFATAPEDIEVLLVPGGLGARSPDLNATLEYITAVYPKLKFLITVCTGAMVVAKTGLLNGVRATTNKAAWKSVVATEPRARWIPRARWAVDGKVWSSSGVSAGIDVTLAWIECLYGGEVAGNVTK
jgi:transcriptional regulator GlxA family with amidase domain